MSRIIIVLFVLVSGNSFCQFPEKWMGHYAGIMYISNGSNQMDSVDVSLDLIEVVKDSVWTYNMHYFNQKYGSIEKNYHIIRSADGKSYYMDELNGIKIDMAYMNDSFYEYFEVDGMMYCTTMRRLNGGIFFEIFGASNEPSSETDSLPDENNTVYKVLSMKPTFAQSVMLMPVE